MGSDEPSDQLLLLVQGWRSGTERFTVRIFPTHETLLTHALYCLGKKFSLEGSNVLSYIGNFCFIH